MKALKHFLKLAWKMDPVYFILAILNSLLTAAKALLAVVLPKYLIDELLGERDVRRLIIYTLVIIANIVGMQLISNIYARYERVKSEELANNMRHAMSKKILSVEYSYLEDPYYLDLKERAIFAINNQNVLKSMISQVSSCLNGVITLIGLVAIMATMGPVLIIALLVGCLLSIGIYALNSKEMVWFQQEIIPINRRFGYYFGVAFDKTAQKEIRIYNMEELITSTILNENKRICDRFDRFFGKVGFMSGVMMAIGELVAAFSYVYVGIRTLSDKFGARLSIGSLTMYVSAAIQFSRSIEGVGGNIVGLFQHVSFLQPYLEFMKLPDETQEKDREEFKGTIESLEFKNVTFTYPKAEKPVLKNISFKIERGQKISIVGLNGAGKSTLVKLICRMFKADSGEILVNGRNIYDYEYNSYMKEISAVFQDYKLFNFSILENVSCVPEGADEERVQRLIEEVGMKEKVSELPNGLNSLFGKEYDEEGIEMSGGQAQKIAIARALYKKAGMVILDEPASALDPIAEAEIYEKFNSLVEDKTAIYISHRMSSSVFCDKILIIDGGTVSDFDSHENLMKKTESLYYKLFMAQAENYKITA